MIIVACRMSIVKLVRARWSLPWKHVLVLYSMYLLPRVHRQGCICLTFTMLYGVTFASLLSLSIRPAFLHTRSVTLIGVFPTCNTPLAIDPQLEIAGRTAFAHRYDRTHSMRPSQGNPQELAKRSIALLQNGQP